MTKENMYLIDQRQHIQKNWWASGNETTAEKSYKDHQLGQD